MHQGVKRPFAFLAQDLASHLYSREYSSWTDARPHQRHAVSKGAFMPEQFADMEDGDLDEDATAVGALLALQTVTHRAQPSRVVRSGSQSGELKLVLPSRRAASSAAKSPTAAEHMGQQDSPIPRLPQLVLYSSMPASQAAALEASYTPASAAAAAAPAAAGAAGFGAALKLEQYGASHMEACEQQQRADSGADRRQKSGTSNSCGSAKDTFDGGAAADASQDLDALDDMDVTVVSETEKGCQAWFPPLPEEIERLRKRMGAAQQQRKRALPTPPRDSGLGAEEADTGTCSTGGGGDEAEQGLAAVAQAQASGGRAAVAARDAEAAAAASRAQDSKRQRFIWTNELHERFVAAVQLLGVKTAVPKAILQIMKVEGMTRENVASHLQKFRMALRRMEMQGGAGGGGGGAAPKGLSQEDMAMLSHSHRILLLDEASNSLKQRQDPAAQASQHACHALLAQAF